eukprot:1161694-Pelagomonas_calceolata.AAC.3
MHCFPDFVRLGSGSTAPGSALLARPRRSWQQKHCSQNMHCFLDLVYLSSRGTAPKTCTAYETLYVLAARAIPPRRALLARPCMSWQREQYPLDVHCLQDLRKHCCQNVRCFPDLVRLSSRGTTPKTYKVLAAGALPLKRALFPRPCRPGQREHCPLMCTAYETLQVWAAEALFSETCKGFQAS